MLCTSRDKKVLVWTHVVDLHVGSVRLDGNLCGLQQAQRSSIEAQERSEEREGREFMRARVCVRMDRQTHLALASLNFNRLDACLTWGDKVILVYNLNSATRHC